MKNLANCKPTEFAAQTVRIRKSVKKWLNDTDIMNIRKRLPNIPDSADENAKKEAMDAQVRENLSAIFDAVMEDHPMETLEVLALICFVEPEHVDDYPMEDYLAAFNELINNQTVIDFFMSLLRLARMLT